MPENSGDNQQEPVYLTTAEAAVRLNLSEDAVRELCKKGMLPGSSQEHKKGPWRIPREVVDTWPQAQVPNVPTTKTPVTRLLDWWKNSPFKLLWAILVASIVLCGVANPIANFFNATRQVRQWAYELRLTQDFPSESKGETLIVIASFYHSTGTQDTEAHNEIKQAIEKAKAELGFASLRVEVEPTHLQADDRAGAEAMGKRYNASIVIWGADTGVRVTVNFLNLKQPDFDAAQVKISETERTQLANPSAYARFVTQDLPGQLTFLSLFAIGQSYYSKKSYANSIPVIEEAIGALIPGAVVEGLADAYFRLGWLYQVPTGNNDKAIANYDQAVKLKPDGAEAYNNRGLAYDDKGDYDRAIADFDQALKLKPDDAGVYSNRGLAYGLKGDYDRAIADFDQALKLKSDDAGVYNNRGNAYGDKGEFDRAIADYERALKLKPDLAAAYNNRGIAYRRKGEYDRAIADYDRALKLKPDYAKAYGGRGVAYGLKGDYDRAIADFDQALKLKPDDAEAYGGRGLVHSSKGEYDHAIADFDQALKLKPNYAEAYGGRGVAYGLKGDYDRAIADLRRYLELLPNAPNRRDVEELIQQLEAQK